MQDGPYFVVKRPDFVARFLLGRHRPETAPDADARVQLRDGSIRYVKLTAPPTSAHGGLSAAIPLDISHHSTAVNQPLAD